MTKVLYLVADGPHSHCYGTDHLLTGFFNVLGQENVFDYPEKDCVHLPSIEARDECQIDSDSTHPRKDHALGDVARDCDLAVLTSCRGDLYEICKRVPHSVPFVAVDFGDALGNFRQPYEQVAGRTLAAYFKRELPLGEDFAIPLPLSYPASRVPNPMPEKANQVFYHATEHGGGAPGIPRRLIANALRVSLAVEQIDVELYPGQSKGTRPSPEEYHARMAESLIGISWNGAVNWDNNRFWENFAYGLCQVAERPRIHMRHQPEDGLHCLYVDKPEEVAPLVKELLEDQEYTRLVARDGHQHFLKYHSSERRAEYVLRVAGKLGA